MNAQVIPFRRGRPSKARLAELHGQVEETQLELAALIDEGRDLGLWLVSLARLGQVQLARGQSPATLLDELERVAGRHLTRMTAAGVHARTGEICPDGVEVRHLGHGRAA